MKSLNNKTLFIGDIGIDSYPEESFVGGCSFNCFTHFSKFKESGILISAIGDDDKSLEIKDKHTSERTHFYLLQGTCSVQEISNDESGEKVFLKYHPGVLADFTLSVDMLTEIVKAKNMVIPVYKQIQKLIYQIKDLNHPDLILDLMNLDEFSDYQYNELLSKASLVFCAVDLEEKLKLNKLEAWSNKYSVPIIATLAKDGVVIFNNGKALRIEVKPITVVDSTGAGDSFIGYVIAHISETQLDLYSICEKACDYAQKTLLQKGTIW